MQMFLHILNARTILMCTLLLCLAGCGGGSGSNSNDPLPVSQATSRELAQICAKDSPYATSSVLSTQGVLADEKKWIKAYLSERYLWYKDIPIVNADDSRYNEVGI